MIKIRFLVMLCLILPAILIQAQSVNHFHKKERIIHVFPATNSFSSQVNYIGTCSAQAKNNIRFYFGELQKISNIKAKYLVNNKWKKISKKKFSTNSLLTSSFYSGLQTTTIPFPVQQEDYYFNYSYDIETKDLLFLSRLDFTDAERTDTFSYKIILPLSHELHYLIEDSLQATNLIQIKTYEQDDKWVYEFTGFPSKEVGYPSDKSAWIRLIVTPKEVSPYDYYNDWYANLVKPNAHLSPELIAIIQAHVAGMESDRERIEAIFNLIKERTSYIAIENGIGAVMPRDANKIWSAQQGDCKDMSNLLCQSLRALGYDAQLALSATIGHSFNLDFPSLASANHVICVLQFEEKWLYLDATERSGFFGHPSRQIQGRTIFIIDEDRGQLHDIPEVKAIENRVVHQLDFEKKKNGLAGKIYYRYHGLSQIDLRNAAKSIAKNRLENNLKNYLGEQSSNLAYKEVQLLLDDSICQIKATVHSERNFTNIRKKEYLSLAFLPFPHQQKEGTAQNELHFYKTCDQQFTVVLNMDKALRLQVFEPVSEKDMGISFDFSVTQTAADQIQIKYQYTNELLELHNESLVAFQRISQLIKKTLQKSIIYEDPT